MTPGFYTDNFDCEWPFDVTVLSLSGHMHSTGLTFWVEHIKADGSNTEIYRVEDWDSGLHPYFPVIVNYDPGELVASEGDILEPTVSGTTQPMRSWDFQRNIAPQRSSPIQ